MVQGTATTFERSRAKFKLNTEATLRAREGSNHCLTHFLALPVQLRGHFPSAGYTHPPVPTYTPPRFKLKPYHWFEGAELAKSLYRSPKRHKTCRFYFVWQVEHFFVVHCRKSSVFNDIFSAVQPWRVGAICASGDCS